MGLPAALSAQNEINEFLHARLAVLERIVAELHPTAYPNDFQSITTAEIESSSLSAAAKARVTSEGNAHKDKVKKK